jgi:hypothetical protein
LPDEKGACRAEQPASEGRPSPCVEAQEQGRERETTKVTKVNTMGSVNLRVSFLPFVVRFFSLAILNLQSSIL